MWLNGSYLKKNPGVLWYEKCIRRSLGSFLLQKPDNNLSYYVIIKIKDCTLSEKVD